MRIPGESAEWRAARDTLLEAESALRAQTEAVASMRRALPEGPPPAGRYRFAPADGADGVGLEDLFENGRQTLFFYSFMFAPQSGQGACPMCVAMLDSLDAAAPHISDRISLAVAAKASPQALRDFAENRGWGNLRLYSTCDAYNGDYGCETADGAQLPMAHVWTRRTGDVRYFWGSELFHRRDPDWPAHPRHVDAIWPLWNVLDMTPDGRGEAWFPKLDYAA